jgi:hypothetical protein
MTEPMPLQPDFTPRRYRMNALGDNPAYLAGHAQSCEGSGAPAHRKSESRRFPRMWMKWQTLAAAPLLERSPSRSDDIAPPCAMRIRIRSRMRVGLFADELARLSPAKSLPE